MGRDKGQAKGKAAATAAGAAAAPKASAAVQLSLRPDECPLCGHDVAVSEEQHILGTCGACGEHHYHTFCVQGHLEKVLRPMIREGGYGTKAWAKVEQKIKVRPCDMFATNGTAQRLPVNCPACKSGLMLAADMVKPVRKLTPAPPVPPPKQPRSQQAAAAAAPKKGPATPSPSGSTLARQQAAAARASLAGVRSSSGLARAGSASSGGAGSGLASGGARPDSIPSRPAWLRLCNSVLEDERCYVYNCPFCHSEEEQQEREAAYLEKQQAAARQRRAAELEAHRREQEQRQRQEGQAGEEEQVGETATAMQASLAQAQQAEMRRQALAREEATLQLSEDVLALMKRHKRMQCIASLTEMGYSADQSAAAADAAGCEPAAAASLLVDGGLASASNTAVSVIREARDLLAEGTKLGLSPAAVEAALAAADGDWEQAWWELQQAHSAAQAPSLAGSAASSAAVVAPVAASSAQMSRQGSTASSSAAAVSSHLLGSSWAGAALGAPAAAALPAGSAASSSTALNEWGSQDPQLASATSAWRQPVQPAASAASAGAAIGYDDGFAAGMAAALQGLQQQPDASAAAALAGEQPPAAPAPDAAGELLADTDAYGWVPPPQERPPASDAEVAPHLEELGEKGSSEDMADFVAGVAAAKDKAVLVADAYLRITMTGWLALVLLVRLALAKVGMGHRLLMVLDGPCSWMKRWWTDRSRVGTPGDPVRGTAATKARAEYRQNDIPFITSADEQDHESQRMGVLGLVAVLIDQDSDFFDFLMRLWLRGIQVEQVFKKLGDDGHMRWVRLNFESWYQELRTKVTSDPNLSDEERMDRVDLFLELLQMLCASDIGFPILGVGRDLICKWMLILVRERGSDLLRLTSARDPVQQEEALQIVVDFLGTSRILPGRAAVKAMSLEVAACAYVHSSGPAFWRAGVADMPCLLLPRLLSRQRLLAAHRQLYSAADMAATQLAFTQQLAERRLAVQQAVLDEARQGLTAAAATREAEGRPLQLPAAIPQLLPSASQMEWTDGRLPQPAHVVLAVLILACRVPMSEARRLLGSHLSSSAASTHHWIALGGKSMQQLVRHLQQFGGLQPEEAMAAREAAEFEDLMAGAGRLLQQAVEQRGAPPEVLDAHASLVPTPELIEVCADGRTRPSPAMWACVELHLMGINAEDAVALVEGAPAAAAVRQWATRSLAATLSQTLAAGDASEAVAALRAIAAVDGTAGTAHLSAQEAAFWRQHLMRLREQACRRLPPLVSRQRLSQAEAVMLVACIARVSLPPDDTLHAAKQAFKASTLLAATLLSLFPSRFTAPTALLAAGSNANNRGTALKPGDTLWPLVRQLKADFGAAREQAAAQAAEAAEEELAAAAAEAAEAEAAAEAAAGKQQKKCSECGATSTSVWRPHPDDPAKRVCHACRQKMDIASGRRPTDVEYKRRRQEKEAQQAQQQQQPSPQPQQAQQAQQQQVEQPQQAQQQQEAEQAPPPPPKRKAAKKQKPPPLDQQQQQHCDKVAAALLAAAGRAACAKAGVTSGPLGLSAAAAAGSPSPQQLAARQWYLVDVVGALCGVLAERVARRELSLEAAKSKARRAAELVPPEDWACPRGNFKVKPTAAACVLYAVDPSSIGIPAAMVAAGGSPNVKPTKHLEEGGTLSWVMPQLGTSINPTGVHVNRKRKQ